jgi:pyruvate dehydrogenase E2 component (dihydrolipoamide acetyltransferase)
MPVDIVLPDLGENITEGGVLEIRVKPGDAITANDVVVVIEAEKSTVEVPAGVNGTITEVAVKKGQTVKAGAVLARAEAGAAVPAAEKKKPVAATAAATPTPKPAPPIQRNGDAAPLPSSKRFTSDQLIPAGPATRRLARKLGVDLAQVRGSGPRGRVTQDDVIGHSQRGSNKAGGGVAAPPLPDFAKWGPIENRPLEMIGRKTAEQMALAWSLIPHVTHHDLADVTDLESFRRSQADTKVKLTITAFALKASAVALKEFPQFNASLDMAGHQVILKNYYHIGVAVDTDRGLVVPVIRDVDRKSVRELAAELTEVADKARNRKLQLDDMKGGTFTISNLGGIGGIGFTPIVNWPEVAILGLSRSRDEVVMRDGQPTTRLMLPLSLSYDHRIINGADGARFTRRIAALLENPMLLLVEA